MPNALWITSDTRCAESTLLDSRLHHRRDHLYDMFKLLDCSLEILHCCRRSSKSGRKTPNIVDLVVPKFGSNTCISACTIEVKYRYSQAPGRSASNRRTSCSLRGTRVIGGTDETDVLAGSVVSARTPAAFLRVSISARSRASSSGRASWSRGGGWFVFERGWFCFENS